MFEKGNWIVVADHRDISDPSVADICVRVMRNGMLFSIRIGSMRYDRETGEEKFFPFINMTIKNRDDSTRMRYVSLALKDLIKSAEDDIKRIHTKEYEYRQPLEVKVPGMRVGKTERDKIRKRQRAKV